MSDVAQQSSQAGEAGGNQGRSLAEWLTAGTALAIVATVVGLIVYDWLATPPTPAVLQIAQVGEVRAQNGQFYVEFEVHNAGGVAVEALRVLGELEVDGEVVEEAEQEFDFFAVDDTRSGEFVFATDPAQGELTLRIVSFQEP